MITYDFLLAKQANVSNVWTDSQHDLSLLLVNFLYELGKIMTRYDFLDARFFIWLTFTFGQHMILGKEWPDITARG